MKLFNYKDYPAMLENRLPEAWDRAIIGACVDVNCYAYSVPKMLSIFEEISPEGSEDELLYNLFQTIIEPNIDNGVFIDDSDNDIPDDYHALASGAAGLKLLSEAEDFLNKHKSKKINAISSVYFMALMDRYGKTCYEQGFIKGSDHVTDQATDLAGKDA